MTMTFTVHDRRPKVIMLIGINKILSRGFTNNINMLNMHAEISMPCHPPFTEMPGRIWVVSHSEKA